MAQKQWLADAVLLAEFLLIGAVFGLVLNSAVTSGPEESAIKATWGACVGGAASIAAWIAYKAWRHH